MTATVHSVGRDHYRQSTEWQAVAEKIMLIDLVRAGTVFNLGTATSGAAK
jgi:hypothetical protein